MTARRERINYTLFMNLLCISIIFMLVGRASSRFNVIMHFMLND